VVADMLVGMERYAAYNVANRAVQNFIAKKDDRISDLASVEVDKTLSAEQVNVCLYYYTLIGTRLYSMKNQLYLCRYVFGNTGLSRYKKYI